MIEILRILGKFFDPQILLGERSGTFRDSEGRVVLVDYGCLVPLRRAECWKKTQALLLFVPNLENI